MPGPASGGVWARTGGSPEGSVCGVLPPSKSASSGTSRSGNQSASPSRYTCVSPLARPCWIQRPVFLLVPRNDYELAHTKKIKSDSHPPDRRLFSHPFPIKQCSDKSVTNYEFVNQQQYADSKYTIENKLWKARNVPSGQHELEAH